MSLRPAAVHIRAGRLSRTRMGQTPPGRGDRWFQQSCSPGLTPETRNVLAGAFRPSSSPGLRWPHAGPRAHDPRELPAVSSAFSIHLGRREGRNWPVNRRGSVYMLGSGIPEIPARRSSDTGQLPLRSLQCRARSKYRRAVGEADAAGETTGYLHRGGSRTPAARLQPSVLRPARTASGGAGGHLPSSSISSATTVRPGQSTNEV